MKVFRGSDLDAINRQRGMSVAASEVLSWAAMPCLYQLQELPKYIRSMADGNVVKDDVIRRSDNATVCSRFAGILERNEKAMDVGFTD